MAGGGPERCGYRDIGTVPRALSLKMHVGPTQSGPTTPASPRSARDYMASGESRLACNSSAVILRTKEADVVKSGRDSPICLQALLFASGAAGVPAGRHQPEVTKACREPSRRPRDYG